ncbi:PAS domain-containing protein [Microvirga lenta]|uniref:PAS domain-containing protein n=1 Tax=Microvirga lenta TaxID=2881337 RepID=UPI001CFF9FB1|nr:PAS domain-containing protein [Microvirga lenta]MCB5175121.1 PAS domain-containing protein [Microvirga lenta]
MESETAGRVNWPYGNSQTAALIRDFDWSRTSLGNIETWSQALKTVVDLILVSCFPMVVLWGRDLIQIYNDGYIGIAGDRHPEAMGQAARSYWPDTWHINASICDRVLQGETISLAGQSILEAHDRSRAENSFTLCYNPLRGVAGGIEGLLLTVIGTPSDYVVESGLWEGEGRYRQISEALPQIVWSSDASGNVDFFNSRWFAYTGLRGDEGYSAGWKRTIHPDERSHTLETWSQALRTGTPFEVEYRLRRADGSYRWHMDRAVPVYDAQGNVVRWFGTLTDIDDRRRAEEALRESEERFRQFAENSSAVLWVLDVETMRLEYLSPSFQQVWGEPLDVVPRDFAKWIQSVHPDDRDDVVAALARVRQEGEVIVKEYRVVRPDGTVRWVQNTGFPILDERGKVRRVAGIAQDVTKHDGSMVYVVDSNEASRQNLSLLLQGAGYQVKTFSSGQAFLDVAPVLVPGCVVLDLHAPEAGELTILRELKTRRIGLPVVVVGEAHGNVAFGVQAMKAGALDFLDVPYEQKQLLDAVASAQASIRDIAERDQAAELAKARIAALSAREREVLERLLTGGTNKTIARDLDISPRTVEAHRARIMERLGAQSLPELVQIAMAAGLKQGSRSMSDADR